MALVFIVLCNSFREVEIYLAVLQIFAVCSASFGEYLVMIVRDFVPKLAFAIPEMKVGWKSTQLEEIKAIWNNVIITVGIG